MPAKVIANPRVRKRFTEPVALSSIASIDLSPSGLAAFRVQPLETTSTYSRSVLGAHRNLAISAGQRQRSRARKAATSAKSSTTSASPERQVIQNRVEIGRERHEHPAEKIVYVLEGSLEYSIDGPRVGPAAALRIHYAPAAWFAARRVALRELEQGGYSMRRLAMTVTAVAALVFAGSAAAALTPWTFVGPGVTCPVVSTFDNGVLHLEKNCTTPTNASAGATISGVTGQTFGSGSFTLAASSQCQGGSPRFNVVTTDGTFFLGCNNVTPTMNADGTATYTFTPATIAAGGGQVPFPTGTIQSVDVLIDVQGTADLSGITVNGQPQVPSRHQAKNQCKHGGWKTFTSPKFKNQGQCVSSFNHQNHQGDQDSQGDQGNSHRH
jgi:hypothetical protein